MTSKSYVIEETAIQVNGEVGADYAWSMEGLTDGAGRVSAQIDLGAGARSGWYDIYFEHVGQATPTQYEGVDYYKAEAPGADSTMIPGDIGASDAALGDLDQLTNLDPITTTVQEEADTTKMVKKARVFCSGRYLSLVGVDNIGATLNATDSNFQCLVVPVPFQGQAT